ncbi:MAG: pyridoxamine 5'-phosphate oxidase [Corynebacteriales bacterium]|nr:pyridoxamine 5'-phosphate oxidase [Mycobacteriales bacterium]
MTDLSKMRQEYGERSLDISDMAPDWVTQLHGWLAYARENEVDEPNAMVVSTVNARSEPSLRTVLLKYLDPSGLVFFTNYRSRKGRDIEANANVSALFGWYSLHRQVIVAGRAEKIPPAESNDYFRTRPYGAQLGAHASQQSQVIAGREELLHQRDAAAQKYRDDIPRPAHWGGIRIVPSSVEFWQGRADRLHDRIRYRLDGNAWRLERLAP